MISTTPVVAPHRANTSWYLDINDWARHSSWAHGFMHAWALWAGLVTLAAMAVAVFLAARRRGDLDAVVLTGLTAIGAVIALAVNQPVAHAAGELRPYVTHPGALVLVSRANDFAFPSDHATVAGALAAGLVLVDRRVGIPAVVLGLLLAFARVYVGAHYPGDVVAGLLLGAVVTGIVIVAGRRPADAVVRWTAASRAGPLVSAARPGDVGAGADRTA